MNYRVFGKTEMQVSEVGFGAWGIGGAYGKVERRNCIEALEKAEALGCNFVDTAAVYGDSEEILGEFLPARRDRWLVATKYSGQNEGLLATAEKQLKRLRIDAFDFYQIHWAPGDDERALYDALYALKELGKTRFIGVSLYYPEDIDYVIDHAEIDGFQIMFGLLDPEPFLSRLDRIRENGLGIVIRSCLKDGFLTGKFDRETTFSDPADRRHKMTREQIVEAVEAAERFRFLEEECGSMMLGAARYPLSFPEVSTLILGTKSAAQAAINFGDVPGGILASATLQKIKGIQTELEL